MRETIWIDYSALEEEGQRLSLFDIDILANPIEGAGSKTIRASPKDDGKADIFSAVIAII